MKQSARRALALVLAVLALLALVPVLLVGDCAHPFGDDYAFSQFVHHALEDGTSVLGALAYTVKRYYFGWQGTYAGAALMALQPGILSEHAYFLTPVLMLLALILSTGLLAHTILCRWLGQDRWTWLGAAAGLLLVTIQYQPDVMQAFFWWNGAVYYTGFYALMLLLFTCLIRLRLAPRHPKLLFAAALALAALVGGGNYVTGLLSCLVLASYLLFCAVWDRKRLWQPACVGAVLLTGFLINVLAPGNQVRQGMSSGLPVLQAIGESIIQAGRDVPSWSSLPLLALLEGMIPVLWRALKNVDFSFPLPGAAVAIAFLALACQNAPHFYALAAAGPGRLRNIVYDTYPWLLLLAEGYCLGWLRRKSEGELLSLARAKVLMLLALVLAATGFAMTAPRTAFGQCAAELLDGSARAYDEHVNGWAELLADPDTDPVCVSPLPVRPPLLYSFNLAEDPENFANIAAANYYRKTAVAVCPPEGAGP